MKKILIAISILSVIILAGFIISTYSSPKITPSGSTCGSTGGEGSFFEAPNGSAMNYYWSGVKDFGFGTGDGIDWCTLPSGVKTGAQVNTTSSWTDSCPGISVATGFFCLNGCSQPKMQFICRNLTNANFTSTWWTSWDGYNLYCNTGYAIGFKCQGRDCGSFNMSLKCANITYQAPCVPNCTGKVCGNNGCGGSCGTCTLPQQCNNTLGTCYTPLTPITAVCGNGSKDPGESCDDGQNPPLDGDGCNSTCGIESGWACTTTPGHSSVCNPICGDGIIISNKEQCDCGNSTNPGPQECGGLINGQVGSFCNLTCGIVTCVDQCKPPYFFNCSGNNITRSGCDDINGDQCYEALNNSVFNQSCSSNQQCTISNNGESVSCINSTTTPSITTCSQYTTKSDCEDYDSDIAENSVPNSAICGKSVTTSCSTGMGTNTTTCECIWNNTINNCTAGYSSDLICPPPASSTNYGKCSWSTSSVNKCNQAENVIVVTETASWIAGSSSTPDSDCVTSTKSYPCPNTAKLPFFGFIDFLLASLIICIVYLYIIKIYKE